MQVSATEKTTPRVLRPGGTIGLVSPSARLSDVLDMRHDRSIEVLYKLGYKVKEFFSPIPRTATHREQIEHRVKELHEAFSDTNIKAIVCTSGGSHANELLRSLNYDLIRANPKIFVGYSDITVLHLALYTHADLRTFYGPTTIVELGEEKPFDFTVQHFKHVLSGDSSRGEERNRGMARSETCWPQIPEQFLYDIGVMDQVGPQKTQPSPKWTWLRPGKCSGRVLGGCIAPLTSSAGTSFCPSFEGCILLIETHMDDSMDTVPLEEIRTQLTNLGIHGVFRQCVGIIVGRPILPRDPGLVETYRGKFWKIFSDVLDLENFTGPVLTDVDVGHTDPILTVPLGAVCELDSERDTWRVLDDAVSL